jgi:hypothetical protein
MVNSYYNSKLGILVPGPYLCYTFFTFFLTCWDALKYQNKAYKSHGLI